MFRNRVLLIRVRFFNTLTAGTMSCVSAVFRR